ncbi:putative defense protein 3, partial [Orchesella cincta]
MWTAPHHFVGSVVFVATFWKSSRLYWPHIESDPIVVTKEIHQPNFSKDDLNYSHLQLLKSANSPQDRYDPNMLDNSDMLGVSPNKAGG